MCLGGIGIGLARQRGQGSELLGDVAQGHRLERTPPADRLLVEGDGLLGRLPGRGELEQEPLAVEVLDGGHPAGVGVGAQISPFGQLLQRLRELVVAVPSQLGRDVLGAQMHDEAFLRLGERTQHPAVELRVRRAEVGEGVGIAVSRLGQVNHRAILPDECGLMRGHDRSR